MTLLFKITIPCKPFLKLWHCSFKSQPYVSFLNKLYDIAILKSVTITMVAMVSECFDGIKTAKINNNLIKEDKTKRQE